MACHRISSGRSLAASCTYCNPDLLPISRCQPIELDWTPRPPARYLVRKQIVDNMPDPLSPLFDELYLTQMGSKWWEWEPHFRGKNPRVGGGAEFVSLNGYAYIRMDWAYVHEQREPYADEIPRHPLDTDAPDQERHDLALMIADLSEVERRPFAHSRPRSISTIWRCR